MQPWSPRLLHSLPVGLCPCAAVDRWLCEVVGVVAVTSEPVQLIVDDLHQPLLRLQLPRDGPSDTKEREERACFLVIATDTGRERV